MFTIKFPLIYNVLEALERRKKCCVRKKLELFVRLYHAVLLYGIPALLLLSNFFTVYALCRQQRRLSTICWKNEDNVSIRINGNHSNRKQWQLTIMLVTINFSFYLFTTPAMVFYILESRLPRTRELNKIKTNFLLSQISVILLQLNNAVS